MSVKTLVILNDPPYGTERSWNGLRLAGSLAGRDGPEVGVFLLGDAVGCAVTGQKVPDGYYHLDRMIESAARHPAPPSTSSPAGRRMPTKVIAF
jgi:uncharacterized protein involved in oxidation of intracellular sulfur